MLVLPVPGGPHRIIEASRPAATIRPIAPSGPVRCSWPTISSSERRPQPVGERRVGGRRFGGARRDLLIGEQVGHAPQA